MIGRREVWIALVALAAGAGGMGWLMHSCRTPPGEQPEPFKAELTERFREAEKVIVEVPVKVPVFVREETERLRDDYDRPDIVSVTDLPPPDPPEGETAPERLPTITEMLEAWARSGREGALALAEHEIPPLPYGGTGLTLLEPDSAISLTVKPHPAPPPKLLAFDAAGRIGAGPLWRTSTDRLLESVEGFDQSQIEGLIWGDWSPAVIRGKWRPYIAADWATSGETRVHAGVYREFE